MSVLEWLFLTITDCDAAEPRQLGSQDAATPMMQGIIDLHHDIFFFLILILVFVSRILVRALWHFHYKSSDEQSLTFDSYTIPEDDPELGQSRLLEVDNRVVVPAKTNLRIIVTPADVPHSWAVPSSGVKCDAVPSSGVKCFFYGVIFFLILGLGGVAFAAPGEEAGGPSNLLPPVPGTPDPGPGEEALPVGVEEEPPAPTGDAVKEKLRSFFEAFKTKRAVSNRFFQSTIAEINLDRASPEKRRAIVRLMDEIVESKTTISRGTLESGRITSAQDARAELTERLQRWADEQAGI